jgi:hypothetical protein
MICHAAELFKIPPRPPFIKGGWGDLFKNFAYNDGKSNIASALFSGYRFPGLDLSYQSENIKTLLEGIMFPPNPPVPFP